ncbi:Sec-independent protein translocase TatB [Timonella sp. A28]|uniref:Sec-independent protein translocase TatB n=1 Tax=Timonella sp. A28 TaxID=3442640 RepID=UPI003EB95797
MFDINGSEFLIIVVIAVIVIGPERLPRYAEQFAHFVRGIKRFVADTKTKVDTELGDEISSVDWQKLDPRQYDPRRIVKETLFEDTILDPHNASKIDGKSAAQAGFAAGAAGSSLGFDSYTPLGEGKSAPFDNEAT